MQTEIFADMIGEITLVRGAMRIDLVSMSPQARDENGNPRPEFRQRIVMPLEGFVQSFSSMERMISQLAERGVITRGPEAAAGPVDGPPHDGKAGPPAKPSAGKAGKKEPSSPNF